MQIPLKQLFVQNFASSASFTVPPGVRTLYISGSGGDANENASNNNRGGNSTVDTNEWVAFGAAVLDQNNRKAAFAAQVSSMVPFDTQGAGSLAVVVGAGVVGAANGWVTIAWYA